MIDATHVIVRLGRQTIVDDVSFSVDAGRSLALWGENGAGKTTLLRAVLGLLPCTGLLSVAGHDVRRAGRQARGAIGYVPQQLALYDELSTLGYLRYVAGLRKVEAHEAPVLLARVGLADQAAKPVGRLSGGMRQRLALAAALLGDPPVLVLDEPTASLDAGARQDFLRLLSDLRRSDKTLLLTSHRTEEVATLADEVHVLAGGRTVLACRAAELTTALNVEVAMHLMLAAGAREPALAVLTDLGFTARRNGRGIVVDVAPGARAAPVQALVERGFQIDDLAIEEGSWTAS
jgi:ABC-type multidrug transport system ATPase subunit